MGKRVTITTTRQDPSTPWFMETSHGGAVNQAVTDEQAYLIANYENVSFNIETTSTTHTLTLEFALDSVYDGYAALISDNLASPYMDYCAANNMTVTKDITDI